MNKSELVHIKSKYFGFLIVPQHNGYDVFRKNGEHMLCVRDGVDLSEGLGCPHRRDLAPIPKVARLYKVVGEKIVQDELYAQRLEQRKKFVSEDGHVPSCEELAAKAAGLDVRTSSKAVQGQIRARMGAMFDEKQVEFAQAAKPA